MSNMSLNDYFIFIITIYIYILYIKNNYKLMYIRILKSICLYTYVLKIRKKNTNLKFLDFTSMNYIFRWEAFT